VSQSWVGTLNSPLIILVAQATPPDLSILLLLGDQPYAAANEIFDRMAVVKSALRNLLMCSLIFATSLLSAELPQHWLGVIGGVIWAGV
jgi:hypothetical protein